LQSILIRFNTPIGFLTLESNNNQICKIEKDSEETKIYQQKPEDQNIINAKNQIIEFLTGIRQDFNLQFDIPGSDLFYKIYEIVMQIPYGSTISYGSVAKKAGIIQGGRVVGNVLAQNPLPLLIPCHRVIRSDGSIGNYSLGGSICKNYLLTLEANRVSKEKK